MSDTDSSAPAAQRRGIRSFVLRSGRATTAQQRALDELWPRYGIDESGPLDLARIFGRRRPHMLEIGFGSGEALLAFAQQHPDINCIGIEVHRPGVGHLLLGAQAGGVNNLRVIDRDAVLVL